MRIKSLLLFTFLLIAALFSSAGLVQAQAEAVISELEIDLWPEYDRRSVLVIYRISLLPTTALPAEMTVRIPSDAGRPFNVAMQNVEGLYRLNYDSVISGDWILVTFTTPSPNIQIEYYDPRLLKDDQDRYFIYSWPGDYKVDDLTVYVQKPANATGMSIQPDMGEGKIGEDGLMYYHLNIGAVNLETPFSIEISYQKPDDSLSVNLQPVQPVQSFGEQTPGRVQFMDTWPFIIGVLGALLVIAGLIWYWQAGLPRLKLLKREANAGTPHRSADAETSSPVYCNQCGRRATVGDVFCRSCGTKLQHD